MSKTVKNLLTDEYRQSYGELGDACVVDVTRLDGVSANRFRRALHEKNIKVQVVKNSLARRALGDLPLGPLARALDGPCALVTGGESAIDLAKTLVNLKKIYPNLELKQSILEGDPDLLEVERVAKMKGRTEVLGDLAGLLLSPAASLAGCLNGPGGRLAGCLKAMADKEQHEDRRDERDTAAATDTSSSIV
jgi:large subunit ribosomal protein L10